MLPCILNAPVGRADPQVVVGWSPAGLAAIA